MLKFLQGNGPEELFLGVIIVFHLKLENRQTLWDELIFFLHGGSTLGSSGCIDIANGMDEFTKDYQEYGADMLLNVHYPYKRW